MENCNSAEMISLMKDIRDAMAARDESLRKEKLYLSQNWLVPKWLVDEITGWKNMVKELQEEHATYPGSRYNPKNKHLLY